MVIRTYMSWISHKRYSERQQMNKLTGNKGWLIPWTCISWPLSWSASLGMRVLAWWLAGQAKDHHLPLFIVHALYCTHREGWADLQEQQLCKNPGSSQPFLQVGMTIEGASEVTLEGGTYAGIAGEHLPWGLCLCLPSGSVCPGIFVQIWCCWDANESTTAFLLTSDLQLSFDKCILFEHLWYV